MPLLEDLLLRFRRVWAPPGPVTGQAGVPADMEARLGDELAAVLEALAAVEEEGAARTREAEHEAARLLAAARAEAERLLQEAESRAGAARTAAAADRVREREAMIDGAGTRAEAEAEAVRERARSRLGDLVAQVLAGLFEGLALPLEEGDACILGGR